MRYVKQVGESNTLVGVGWCPRFLLSMEANMSETNIKFGSGFTFIKYMIFAILAYFVYGTVDGILSIILITFSIGIVSWLSIVPIIGWIGAMYVNWYIIIPKILLFTSTEYTWIITLAFAIDIVVSLIVTIAATILIGKLIIEIFK